MPAQNCQLIDDPQVVIQQIALKAQGVLVVRKQRQ